MSKNPGRLGAVPRTAQLPVAVAVASFQGVGPCEDGAVTCCGERRWPRRPARGEAGNRVISGTGTPGAAHGSVCGPRKRPSPCSGASSHLHEGHPPGDSGSRRQARQAEEPSAARLSQQLLPSRGPGREGAPQDHPGVARVRGPRTDAGGRLFPSVSILFPAARPDKRDSKSCLLVSSPAAALLRSWLTRSLRRARPPVCW